MGISKRIIIGFGILALAIAMPALAYYSPGAPTGFVNDFAGVMSVGAKQQLETELINFEKQTKHEIAVVTIDSLKDDTIDNFAVELFKEWGIGKKGADNGVLFLVAVSDRQMRIEVGYGLEGALTDLQSNAIINQIAKPNFQQGNFDQGIIGVASEIEKATQGEPLSVNVNPTDNGKVGSSDLLQTLFVIGFFVVIGLLRGGLNVLGKTKSFWLGGVLGGILGTVIAWFAWGTLISIIGLAVPLALFGLGIDYGASRKGWGKSTAGKNTFWGGFFGGGSGGSGGGGFGGFGGGGSGGGGSSGGW